MCPAICWRRPLFRQLLINANRMFRAFIQSRRFRWSSRRYTGMDPSAVFVFSGLFLRLRCATNSWVSAGLGRASLPEFLPAATHPATAQGDDGVGAPDGPVHSGALESLSNDRFTARLDDARPDE